MSDLADLTEFCTLAHAVSVESRTRIIAECVGDVSPFVVTGFRGRSHIVTLFPSQRDEMLWAVQMAVAGFGCDRVSACADTFMMTGKGDLETALNPDTGKPWAAGDVSRAFQLKRPWVSEALHTSAIDKVSQLMVSILQAYRVEGSDVTWQEPEVSTQYQVSGVIPEVLMAVLSAPDLEVALHKELGETRVGFGLTPSQERAHLDAVILRVCVANDIPVLYGASDPAAQAVVQKSLDNVALNAEMGVADLHVEPFDPS